MEATKISLHIIILPQGLQVIMAIFLGNSTFLSGEIRFLTVTEDTFMMSGH